MLRSILANHPCNFKYSNKDGVLGAGGLIAAALRSLGKDVSIPFGGTSRQGAALLLAGASLAIPRSGRGLLLDAISPVIMLKAILRGVAARRYGRSKKGGSPMDEGLKQLKRVLPVACWSLALLAVLVVGWAGEEVKASENDKKEARGLRPPRGVKWGMSEKEWADVVGKPDMSGTVEFCKLPVRVALVRKSELAGEPCEILATFYKGSLVSLRYEFRFYAPDAMQKADRFRTELRKKLWEKYGSADYPDRSPALLGGSSTWEGKTTTMNLARLRWEDGGVSSYFSLRYYETSFLDLVEEALGWKQAEPEDEL